MLCKGKRVAWSVCALVQQLAGLRRRRRRWPSGSRPWASLCSSTVANNSRQARAKRIVRAFFLLCPEKVGFWFLLTFS